MNKKIIIAILIVLIIIGIGGCYLYMNRDESNSNSNNELGVNESESEVNEVETDLNENEISNTVSEESSNSADNNDTEQNNVLVLYFSATNTTETIAEYISEITGGDLIEILPEEEYTSDDLNYNNSNSRANQEQNDDNARPEIANTNIDISGYDTIYLGYPIWWGDVPKIILTLLDTYDFTGKTVIPFCTSGSTGITSSVNTLKNYADTVNWLDGMRFSSSSTKEDVEEWINE